MGSIQELVNGLSGKNNDYAYECLKELELMSKDTEAVYPYFDTFTEMLDDKNSYLRTRGFRLIIANAHWDKDCKIDEIIDKLLELIMDEKPITARQCIQALPILVKYKPDLKGGVVRALHNANPLKYKETMQNLIMNDIKKSLNLINAVN